MLSTEAFLTNKRGFPVLSKRHQELVSCLLKHNVQIVLRGERRHNPAAGDVAAEQASCDDAAGGAAAPAEGRSTHALQLYWEYLAYLFGRLDEVSDQERVESGYRDYLQVRCLCKQAQASAQHLSPHPLSYCRPRCSR